MTNNDFKIQLEKRTVEFSVAVIKMLRKIPGGLESKNIREQVMRSATAASQVNLVNSGSSTVPVSHWGNDVLSHGNWVMKGSGSRIDYILSGKWQPEWVPGNNLPAPFGAGNTYYVPSDALEFPSGIEWIKGLLGQRIYNGPSVLPSYPVK